MHSEMQDLCKLWGFSPSTLSAPARTPPYPLCSLRFRALYKGNEKNLSLHPSGMSPLHLWV